MQGIVILRLNLKSLIEQIPNLLTQQLIKIPLTYIAQYTNSALHNNCFKRRDSFFLQNNSYFEFFIRII